MNTSFILKGNICFSTDKDTLSIWDDSYLICENGRSKGVYHNIPSLYDHLPIKDYGKMIIIPGLVDLHAHAPQYAFRGLGMDLELLDWLNQHTFPEEAKYENCHYAQTAYTMYVDDLKKGPVTRASIFATIHGDATEILMDLLETSGLVTRVGKVNSDRNGGILQEGSTQESLEATTKWLQNTLNKYDYTQPILTPRFIPSCTDQLLEGLKKVQEIHHLPVQSHLDENKGEIAWVKELCPGATSYSAAYKQYGLFGGDTSTIMAHCVWTEDKEMDLIKEQGVYIAHCPQSNTNLSSGIAPVRKFLDKGLLVGLGSDMAGGFSTSIFRAMSDAIQCSKLRWRLVDQKDKALTMEEAFYLGTKGGGSFFGAVGSFEEDYEFDAIIIDDTLLKHPQKLTTKERLERIIYLSDDRHIIGKYVQGRDILY